MAQQAPSFANQQEALVMLESAMGYITAAADAGHMATATQADALRVLEKTGGMGTAARAWILGSFTADQGYLAEADYSAKAWLMHQTRVSTGAAAGYMGWARRIAPHPQLGAALAAGLITESYARTIATWTGKLPGDWRPAADAILLAAARAGADLRDLAELAAEITARSMPEDQGPDVFEERSVKLETTFDGAGVLRGDLTPGCAEVVSTVLAALSGAAGADDVRSRDQRMHDALFEAMERLAASGLLPERAGAPGQGVGAYLAGGPDAAGGLHRAGAAVGHRRPGGLGRAPGRRLPRRRDRRRVADRGGGRGNGL